LITLDPTMTPLRQMPRLSFVLLASATLLACSGSPSKIGDGGSPDSGLGVGPDGGVKIDGGMAQGPGGTATALVGGGAVSSSAHYVLIGTLGQGPASNATGNSTNYQLRGGVVGATQNQ
jgi:hypothetical protein